MSSSKTQCPCCPYSGSGDNSIRSDHTRRHVQRLHTTIPWDYVDGGGFHMEKLGPMLAIKYKPLGDAKKYGCAGYCFKCCSYIICSGSNPINKLAVVRGHECKEKQVRPLRKGVIKSSEPKARTMTTLDEQFDAIFKELKIDAEYNDNLTVNVKKTLRALVAGKGKAASNKNDWWESLKKWKKVAHLNLSGKEAEARVVWQESMSNWEDDHDSDDEEDVAPVFDPRDVLLPILANSGKEETVITNLRGNIKDLKTQLEQREDVMEQMQREYKLKMEQMQASLSELSKQYSDTRSELHEAQDKIKELTATEPDAQRPGISYSTDESDHIQLVRHH